MDLERVVPRSIAPRPSRSARSTICWRATAPTGGWRRCCRAGTARGRGDFSRTSRKSSPRHYGISGWCWRRAAARSSRGRDPGSLRGGLPRRTIVSHRPPPHSLAVRPSGDREEAVSHPKHLQRLKRSNSGHTPKIDHLQRETDGTAIIIPVTNPCFCRR